MSCRTASIRPGTRVTSLLLRPPRVCGKSKKTKVHTRDERRGEEGRLVLYVLDDPTAPSRSPNETLSPRVRTRRLVGPPRPILCPTVGVEPHGVSPPDPPWAFTRGQCSRVRYNPGVQALGVRPSTTGALYTDLKSSGVPVRPSKTESPFSVKPKT